MDNIITPHSRPVIFSPFEAKACLAGHKTQFRRVAKFPPISPNAQSLIREVVPSLLANPGDLWDVRYDGDNPKAVKCPFGKIGDSLWVQEAFAITGTGHGGSLSDYQYNVDITYQADEDEETWWVDKETYRQYDAIFPEKLTWLSPDRLPRWATRLHLEITDIRVQRLQEIDELDAVEEGIEGDYLVHGTMKLSGNRTITGDWWEGESRDGFAKAWDAAHEKDGEKWSNNCWVWAVTYRVIEENKGHERFF